MSIEYVPNNEDDDAFLDTLETEKVLCLTKYEALYLSDSMTLLMEQTSEIGKVHMPARQLVHQALIPVPLYLIQKIGLAVLETCDPENETQLANIEVSIADLFLLRECCQSFIRVNQELVGYNLLRKVYTLLLEDSILEETERSFINDLTAGIDLSPLSNEEKLKNKKDLES